MTYSEKLRDPRWQKKRLEIFNRDQFMCRLCDDTKTTLHVHHKQYSGEPWEAEDSDLITLCEDCHSFIENEYPLYKLPPEWKIIYAYWDKFRDEKIVYVSIQREIGKSTVLLFRLNGSSYEYITMIGSRNLEVITHLLEIGKTSVGDYSEKPDFKIQV